MNVLEQLRAMGFREKPLQFYDGGDGGGGDPGGGGGGEGGYGGDGPGGTDVSAEVSSDYGGTGPSLGDTIGQGALTGPSGPYGGVNSIDNAQVAAAVAPTIALATELASSPSQAHSLAVNALNDLGFGSVTGLNPNNPTQSVEEMQAAQNVAAAMPHVISAVIPGAGALTTAAQTIGSLLSGQTTVGKAIADLGLGVVANQLGISPGTLSSVINGNLGQAVANTTMAAAGPVIAQAIGVPAGFVNAGLGVSGLGQAANQGIAGLVNESLGITPSTENTSAIANAINEAFGTGQGGAGGAATGGAGAAAPGFDFTGGFAPSFGGGDSATMPTAAPAPAPATPSPAPAPAAQSGANTAAALAALAALGMQEDDRPEEYKVAQIPVQSPFGTLPYGMDKTLPYGLRG